MGQNQLNKVLQDMIHEYGIESVERTLREIHKTTVDKKSCNRTSNGNHNSRPDETRAKKERITAHDYVSKLEVSDEMKEFLKEAAIQYEDKMFLPTFGDVKNFCAIYKITSATSASRISAIPRIFKYLAQLPLPEAQSILSSKSFSGPTQLAPIAEAIRCSSQQKSETGRAFHRIPDPLSSTTRKKEKK